MILNLEEVEEEERERRGGSEREKRGERERKGERVCINNNDVHIYMVNFPLLCVAMPIYRNVVILT